MTARGNVALFPSRGRCARSTHISALFWNRSDFNVRSSLDLPFPPIKLECPCFDTNLHEPARSCRPVTTRRCWLHGKWN